MRTTKLRTFARCAVAILGALLTLASVPAAADETAPAAGDRIFSGSVEAGFRVSDTDDDRSLLFPYDPLTDGPILGLDLLYVKPEIGSLKLEAGFVDEKRWQAELGFSHGSDVGVNVLSEAYTHARPHTAPLPTVKVDTPPPAGMDVDAVDENPGATYRDERRQTSAALKVRIPNYPAHVTATGRIDEHRGDQQMRYFVRGCAAHICHTGSRTRELDQKTQEFTAGMDAHVGPVDLAYSHLWRTYRDEAPDPVVRNLGLSGVGYPAPGDYPHDVNPDLRSGVHSVTLNTNLTNRVVFSMAATDGEQENETSGLTAHVTTAAADLSYRVNSAWFLTGRYNYEKETSTDLNTTALALLEARIKSHTTGSYAQLHNHVLEPEQNRQTGELTARWSPLAALDLNGRVRYRELERYVTIDRENKTERFGDDATTTKSTLASLGARYRLAGGVTVDGTLGQEWSDNPFYAVETTAMTRYGLGATWTPAPVLLVRASWQGYRGENDEVMALERAYAARPVGGEDPTREISGDAFMAMAAYTPSPAFSLTASWSLTDHGVDQDMLFGSPANKGFSYLSPDTEWSGSTQVLDLRARWEAHRRLVLSAEGMWIDNLESYDPTFDKAAGLKELSTVEFTKLLASLSAEVRLMDGIGLTVGGFWAQIDDQADDAGDGTALGALAAVSYRW